MKLSASNLLALTVLFGCPSRSAEPRFDKQPESAPAAPAPIGRAERVDPAPDPANGEAAAKSDEQAAANPAADAVAAPAAPAQMVRNPTSPDPLGGKFTLKDATRGLPTKGTLTATLDTGYGTIECKLFEKETPKTVANFVGLARGLRPFWDAKAAAWVKRPTFDGTTFHRAIADFMIQGGDHLGDGTGGVGYEISDELVKGWSHDRAGLLCMANRGPNTNGGQFFITDAAAPHLTQMNTYTIFGECAPLDVIHRIAGAPRPNPHSERPEPPIPIKTVQISRK